MCAVSPTAKISGWPGIVRSGPTTTRPARSVSTPSQRPAGDAATCRQVRCLECVDQLRRHRPRRRARQPDSRTSTPRLRSLLTAPFASSSENVASARGPASISTMRALRGSMCRYSAATCDESARQARSQLWPVGPAPRDECQRRWSRPDRFQVRFSRALMIRRRSISAIRAFSCSVRTAPIRRVEMAPCTRSPG